MKRMVLAGLVCALASPVLAQPAPEPVSVAGTLAAYTGNSVTIVIADGTRSTVAMKPDWFVSLPQKADIAGVKAGDFVATANTIVTPTSGRATELRILEPGFKPEVGTHTTARRPNTMMTHATVTGVMKTADGYMVHTTAPDGPRDITVPTGTEVTGYKVLARTTLVPGAKVNAVTRQDPDGVWRAGRLLLVP